MYKRKRYSLTGSVIQIYFISVVSLKKGFYCVQKVNLHIKHDDLIIHYVKWLTRRRIDKRQIGKPM